MTDDCLGVALGDEGRQGLGAPEGSGYCGEIAGRRLTCQARKNHLLDYTIDAIYRVGIELNGIDQYSNDDLGLNV